MCDLEPEPRGGQHNHARKHEKIWEDIGRKVGKKGKTKITKSVKTIAKPETCFSRACTFL
jgi:hypothetical protein